jgi:hypothetical protein
MVPGPEQWVHSLVSYVDVLAEPLWMSLGNYPLPGGIKKFKNDVHKESCWLVHKDTNNPNSKNGYKRWTCPDADTNLGASYAGRSNDSQSVKDSAFFWTLING